MFWLEKPKTLIRDILKWRWTFVLLGLSWKYCSDKRWRARGNTSMCPSSEMGMIWGDRVEISYIYPVKWEWQFPQLMNSEIESSWYDDYLKNCDKKNRNEGRANLEKCWRKRSSFDSFSTSVSYHICFTQSSTIAKLYILLYFHRCRLFCYFKLNYNVYIICTISLLRLMEVPI